MSEIREIGKVDWFDPAVGYGFIKRSEGSDLFVHHSEIFENDSRNLKSGDNVEFIAEADKAGRPCARGVRIISSEGGSI